MIQTEATIFANEPHHNTKAQYGYSLWEFDGATWVLKKDRTVTGAIPGNAPQVAGRFRGQLRSIPSIVA